jgi:hypothetical protein
MGRLVDEGCFLLAVAASKLPLIVVWPNYADPLEAAAHLCTVGADCVGEARRRLNVTQPEDLFGPPPAPDLLREPRHQLVARLPGPDEAMSALSELSNAGISTAEAFVVCGDEGVRRLDPTGRHHGLKGRLVRAVQYVTSYGDLIEEDAQHLETGGVIVVLPAEDPHARAEALRILRAEQASRVRYYGDTTYEDLA